MTNNITGIDVSEYFINHYDNSGKLYAVEYKGNPLELQNAIKRLQEENEKLKKKKDEYYLINLDYETKISYLIQALEEINILAKNYCNACDEFKAKTYKALEEIRKEIGDLKNINKLINLQKILDIINEVLNDRD